MTNRSRPSYGVPALEQGIAILRLFTRERRVWNASEVARHIGRPRATVHRLMRTLETLGLVERADPRSHDFRLGVGVLTLGFEYLDGAEIVERTRPTLERLRDETRCSTHLAIRDGGDVVYVARYPWPGVVSASIAIGARVPLYAVGLGRLFLLDLTRADLAATFGEEPLRTFSARTPATLDDLAVLVAADRRRGYVLERSMYAAGVVALSAPIRDRHGAVSAAISITNVETSIVSSADEARLCAAVRRAAASLSAPVRGP